VSHGVTFSGLWPEGPVPGTSKGCGSGAVDLDSKPGLGVGHRWDWEAAVGAKDSLKVADCLGEVALAALMVAVCWECMVGAQAVHLLIPLQNRFGWLLVFRLHYLNHENSALSLFVVQNRTQGGMG
jgi:hypothetical protein